MILLRILLLLTLAAVAFWAWRRLTGGSGAPNEAGRFEPTVQCARCGAHVARRIAIERDGASYCPRHAPDAET